jgi:hypothetical protein
MTQIPIGVVVLVECQELDRIPLVKGREKGNYSDMVSLPTDLVRGQKAQGL